MRNVHTQTPPNAVKQVMGGATREEQEGKGERRYAFPGVVLRGGISVRRNKPFFFGFSFSILTKNVERA